MFQFIFYCYSYFKYVRNLDDISYLSREYLFELS